MEQIQFFNLQVFVRAASFAVAGLVSEVLECVRLAEVEVVLARGAGHRAVGGGDQRQEDQATVGLHRASKVVLVMLEKWSVFSIQYWESNV